MIAELAALTLTASAPLRLSDLLNQARARNPEVRMTQLRSEAAQQSIRPAGALEDPMLMLQLWNTPVDFSTVPVMVQLTQNLPLGGKRGLRTEAATAEFNAAKATSAAKARDVEAEVKRAYFELFIAERERDVNVELANTLELLRKAALSRLETGHGEQSEVLRMQAMLLENTAAQRIAEQSAASARIKLAALLDVPSASLAGPTTTPRLLETLPAEPELEAKAVSARPELEATHQMILRASAEANLARAEKVPDVGISVAEMHTFRMSGLADFLFIGAEVNLPIFGGSKNDPRIEAAHARARAAESESEALRNQVIASVAESYAEVQTQAQLVQLHHQLIPISKEALETARASYAAGRGEYVTVLDALQAYQRHEVELAHELGGYESSLANLEHAVGIDLGLVASSEGGSDAH